MALLFLERMSLGAVLITLLLGLALALKAGISETASGQLGTVQLVGMVAFGAAVKHCSLRFCARAEPASSRIAGIRALGVLSPDGVTLLVSATQHNPVSCESRKHRDLGTRWMIRARN